MKGTKNPINYFKAISYQKKQKEDKFSYYGLWSYMGEFGSGKTLTAVKQTIDICREFPNCILLTNTIIKGIENKTYFFVGAEELCQLLCDVVEEGSTCGYIIFIDELHVVLSDIFKRADDGIFLTYLSQLRKIGIMIIGTCQLYNKCPKTVRDYLKLSGNIVFCKKVFGAITINQYVNMETCEELSNLKLKYEISSWSWYFHTVELYESYETFALVGQIKSLIKKE